MSTLETGFVLALVATAIGAILRLRPAPRAHADAQIEARVERALASALGVDLRRLSLDASLRRDLACTSGDLVAVATVLEVEFGIIIPERVLRHVRTCRDLVGVTCALAEERGDDQPPFLAEFDVDATPA